MDLFQKGCRCIPTAIASVPGVGGRKWAGSWVLPFPSCCSKGKNMQYRRGLRLGNFSESMWMGLFPFFSPALQTAVKSEICQEKRRWGVEVMFGDNVTRNRNI